MAAESNCPDRQMLRKVLLGLASPDTVEEVAHHVEICQRCGKLLEETEIDDNLQAAIRSPGQLVEIADESNLRGLIERVRALRNRPEETAVGGSSASRISRDIFLKPANFAGELGQFGPYQVLRRLGTGGMGIVYLARQQRPARLVALKVLSGATQAAERACL